MDDDLAVDALDVLILCGGRGTRAYPDTVDLPKPLLKVGGMPIVEHIMAIYRQAGCRRFVLAAGYRADLFEDRYRDPGPDVSIVVVDTGVDTDTGRRVALAAPACTGDSFFLTYGDGVGNVDLGRLLAFHREAAALTTVTTVPLPSQYGTIAADHDGRVTEFREKPRLEDHWINAGFFVVERRALGHWQGDNLEREVLPALARRGGLFAYRHRGFWRSMDTYKDRQELESLAAAGAPPWLDPPGPAD